MRSPQEKSAINRVLGSHGLPPLESGSGLCAALGYMIQDHEHLRSILIRCEPEKRRACYESLKCYLRFEAKPLDVYIAESAERAERMQLPTLDAETGDFHWPVTQTIETDVAKVFEGAKEKGADIMAAQEAVDATMAKRTLVLTCKHCTREEVFTGDNRTDCIRAARVAGWVYYEMAGEPREICPECPATRSEFIARRN